MRKSQQPEVNITSSTPTSHDWQSANLDGVAARFWKKVCVAAKGDCWLWTANATGSGLPYGQFTIRAKLTFRADAKRQHHVYAHRMAWLLTFGRIPHGLNVLHRCDVPLCVNPNHLFLGTQADNLADARAKGRLRPRGRAFVPTEFPKLDNAVLSGGNWQA